MAKSIFLFRFSPELKLTATKIKLKNKKVIRELFHLVLSLKPMTFFIICVINSD